MFSSNCVTGIFFDRKYFELRPKSMFLSYQKYPPHPPTPSLPLHTPPSPFPLSYWTQFRNTARNTNLLFSYASLIYICLSKRRLRFYYWTLRACVHLTEWSARHLYQWASASVVSLDALLLPLSPLLTSVLCSAIKLVELWWNEASSVDRDANFWS